MLKLDLCLEELLLVLLHLTWVQGWVSPSAEACACCEDAGVVLVQPCRDALDPRVLSLRLDRQPALADINNVVLRTMLVALELVFHDAAIIRARALHLGLAATVHQHMQFGVE